MDIYQYHHSVGGHQATSDVGIETDRQQICFEMKIPSIEGRFSPNTATYVANEFERTLEPSELFMEDFTLGSSGITESHPVFGAGSPYYMEIPQLPSQVHTFPRDISILPTEQPSLDPDHGVTTMAGSVLHDNSPRLGRIQDDEHLGTVCPPSKAQCPPGKFRIGRSTTKSKAQLKRTNRKKQTKSLQLEPSKEDQNCHGDEVPPTLKETCPDEERFIFESYWRNCKIHGQDNWDTIQSEVCQILNRSYSKAALQMKLGRARSKYLRWLPEDEEILRNAWIKVEQDRYQAILKKFHELGGSRNMCLNSSDMEIKLNKDLRLEEDLYINCYKEGDVPRRRPEMRPRGRSK